ncbi:MAG: DUF4249 domain-containing protein [Bacteroidota bacterium]
MKNLLYVSLLLSSIWTCVEPIDLKIELPEQFLVVDGAFTDSEEVDEVRLSYAVDYDRQIFEAIEKASVAIVREDGISELLVETKPGHYVFQKVLVKGEIGKTYHLEIGLPDGKTYRSIPEVLKYAPPIDRFVYDISSVEFTNDLGRLVTSLNFNLSLQSTINTEIQTDFFRWEVENVYLFEKPYLYYRSFPPDPCPMCYVTQVLDPQVISLKDGRLYASDAVVEEQVATKKMDFSFGFAQSFRVAQYNISKTAFDYWSDINLISNRVGSIFDVPPAAVKGNIERSDGKEEIVLGYFSVAGVSHSTIFITPEDTFEDFKAPPFCGLDPRTPTEVLHPFCYDCMLIDNSSKERPFYWR